MEPLKEMLNADRVELLLKGREEKKGVESKEWESIENERN